MSKPPARYPGRSMTRAEKVLYAAIGVASFCLMLLTWKWLISFGIAAGIGVLLAAMIIVAAVTSVSFLWWLIGGTVFWAWREWRKQNPNARCRFKF